MTGKAGVASAGAVVEQDKGFPRGLQDATLENSQGPGTGPMHFREGLLPGKVSVLPCRAASREKPGLHPARPVFYWSKSAGQLSWGPSGACLNPIQVP